VIDETPRAAIGVVAFLSKGGSDFSPGLDCVSGFGDAITSASAITWVPIVCGEENGNAGDRPFQRDIAMH